MFRVRGPAEVGGIQDPDLRHTVGTRYAQGCNGEPYIPDVHGELIVAEPGDTLESLERESGVPITTNPFDDSRFPGPDFVPVCEYLEDYSHCYEMMFLFSDDGAGVNFFIPKSPGIDADLLTFCATFAESAFDPAAR